MAPYRRKLLIRCLFIGVLCLIPLLSRAAIMIQTAVISGNISAINTDSSVRLDNGKTYFPSRNDLRINLPAGAAVTLRYYVEGEEKNVYFQYAPGQNSLNENTPEPPVNK
ncbi:MAG: hypothetical protein P4L42_13785 [Desulfocapsaceae bacterium]|nr:hypothetical protein [Desulfocapsaceae bacterium]